MRYLCSGPLNGNILVYNMSKTSGPLDPKKGVKKRRKIIEKAEIETRISQMVRIAMIDCPRKRILVNLSRKSYLQFTFHLR